MKERTKLDIVLQSLKDKHRAFIGNRKNRKTSANAEGFKEGLAWAIETIETVLEQETSSCLDELPF